MKKRFYEIEIYYRSVIYTYKILKLENCNNKLDTWPKKLTHVIQAAVSVR